MPLAVWTAVRTPGDPVFRQRDFQSDPTAGTCGGPYCSERAAFWLVLHANQKENHLLVDGVPLKRETPIRFQGVTP